MHVRKMVPCMSSFSTAATRASSSERSRAEEAYLRGRGGGEAGLGEERGGGEGAGGGEDEGDGWGEGEGGPGVLGRIAAHVLQRAPVCGERELELVAPLEHVVQVDEQAEQVCRGDGGRGEGRRGSRWAGRGEGQRPLRYSAAVPGCAGCGGCGGLRAAAPARLAKTLRR
jgi:hypothetical protein